QDEFLPALLGCERVPAAHEESEREQADSEQGRRSGFRSGRERDELLWRRILAGVAAAGDRVIGVRGVDGERRELIGGEGLPGAPREPVEDAIGIEIGVIGGGKRALQVSLNGRAAE